jgi:hypothetical protein
MGANRLSPEAGTVGAFQLKRAETVGGFRTRGEEKGCGDYDDCRIVSCVPHPVGIDEDPLPKVWKKFRTFIVNP